MNGWIIVLIWIGFAVVSALANSAKKRRQQAPDWDDADWEALGGGDLPAAAPPPKPEPVVRRQVQVPQLSADAVAAEQRRAAKALVEEAIRRQQARNQPPPLPLQMPPTVPESVLPSVPETVISQADIDIDLGGGLKSLADGARATAVQRTRNGPRISVASKQDLQRAMVLREVLDRPRAYDI